MMPYPRTVSGLNSANLPMVPSKSLRYPFQSIIIVRSSFDSTQPTLIVLGWAERGCEVSGTGYILYRRRVVPHECDLHRMAAVVVQQRAISELAAAALRHASTQRHACLQFVHSLLRLMLVDGSPHVGGPMLVELVRILEEESVVDV